MLIPNGKAMAETKVKNSRFVAEVIPVQSAEEAKAQWKYRKETYDNGGHIVYAFAVGPQQNICGCSDDGEPSGTAGRPVLAVLKGSGLTNTLITIARYFGGTKLGTGGLVHAYSDAAKAVLEVTESTELVPMDSWDITMPYPLYNTVISKTEPLGLKILNETFSGDVKLTGTIRAERSAELLTLLQGLGNGRILIRRSEES